jgi:hypothetical protein
MRAELDAAASDRRGDGLLADACAAWRGGRRTSLAET